MSGTISSGIITSGGVPIGGKTVNVASNGGSDTVANGVSNYVLAPSSGISTFTLIMPSAPSDGQRVTISAASFGVTTLTLNANGGQTFATSAAITAIAASAFASYMYNAGTSQWFRIG